MRLIRRFMPVVCGAMALAGCSGPDFLNAMAPSDGYALTRDVAYGAGPRRMLDVYTPDGAAGALPTIVYFYGGSWQNGTKDDYRFLGEAFASLGYQVVVPDYRLYPEVRYPAFLEDAAAAVAWVAANDGAVAGRPASAILLMGHSAGAYNGAMLALEPGWLDRAGVARERIAAFAGLAGPYDFLPLVSPNLKTIFGPEDERPHTQPINHVSPNAPPMLLATGPDDETVLPKNSRNLAAALRASDVRVETPIYDRVGHLMIIAAIASPFRFLAPVRADVDRFFRQALAGRPNG